MLDNLYCLAKVLEFVSQIGCVCEIFHVLLSFGICADVPSPFLSISLFH